ncbi:hypothetical protein M8C21_029697 [Ambrosia artemisiifolia]|uniref:Uncharacterized protein n=1 Tax=Ambrosia artemisiifolia TaxID=4212 RepID=A0AAD5G1I0_AMBAR|nr:hypothetical protein M8C21_029697 [Ambrosia artemisiifolia]
MRPVRFDNQTGKVELMLSVSKEGSMLIGWNQSVWLGMVIPDKSKYLNDDSEDTHPKSSNNFLDDEELLQQNLCMTN